MKTNDSKKLSEADDLTVEKRNFNLSKSFLDASAHDVVIWEKYYVKTIQKKYRKSKHKNKIYYDLNFL